MIAKQVAEAPSTLAKEDRLTVVLILPFLENHSFMPACVFRVLHSIRSTTLMKSLTKGSVTTASTLRKNHNESSSLKVSSFRHRQTALFGEAAMLFYPFFLILQSPNHPNLPPLPTTPTPTPFTPITTIVQVEKRLDHITTWYMVMIVLALVLCLPWLDGTITDTLDDSYRSTGLQVLHRLSQDTNSTGGIDRQLLQANLQFYAKNSGSLIYLDLCVAETGYTNGCPRSWPMATVAPLILADPSITNFKAFASINDIYNHFRTNEIAKYVIEGCYPSNPSPTVQCYSTAYFSIRGFLRLWSALNIVKTIIVLSVLASTAVFFSQDAQRLVIGPIQRMTDMVRRLADNPLAAIKNKELDDGQKKQGLETMLLEKVLTKIGHLVQIGFGAAGAEIISKNLMAEGGLNAMVPGKTRL